jgi:TolA-binding protein
MTNDPNQDSDPLPDDLRGFLEAERELDVPAAETRERLSSRLTPLFFPPSASAPGGGDAGGNAAAHGASGSALKAGLGAKLLVPAICTALGAAGGAATHAYLAGSHAEAPAARSAVPVMVPPLPAAAETPEPEATSSPTGSGTSRAASEASGSSLRAERLLLESATAALLRGDTASATTTLQKHARLYPRGALAEEREVLWVKVLRAQGNDKVAEQRATEFKRKFPSSLQQGTVDKPESSK